MCYLSNPPMKIENIALSIIIPDGGLVVKLQDPIQILALVPLYQTVMLR